MNNTVQPFSDVVSVESFGAVIGHTQAEWETLIDIYDRSCEAIEAHDTPAERQLPIPPLNNYYVMSRSLSSSLAMPRREERCTKGQDQIAMLLEKNPFRHPDLSK